MAPAGAGRSSNARSSSRRPPIQDSSRSSRMRAVRRAFLIVGWSLVGVIWWLSLTPQPPHVDFEQSDKVGHFLPSGGVMFWFCVLYRSPRTRLVYAIGFIAMGIGIEYIQRWTGYRS